MDPQSIVCLVAFMQKYILLRFLKRSELCPWKMPVAGIRARVGSMRSTDAQAHISRYLFRLCFSLYLIIKIFNDRTDFIYVFLIFLQTKLDHSCYIYFKHKYQVLKIKTINV
jgi:hypothetical protein